MASENPMKIACLDWGQTISKEEFNKYVIAWRADGPKLPIEFCRIEDSGEVVPVISMNAAPQEVGWSLLKIENLNEACEALSECHAISSDRFNAIGSMIAGVADDGFITEWCMRKALDAVIWIALPPRCDQVEGKIATLEQTLEHLNNTNDEALLLTRKIIECSPRRLATPYRSAIIKNFGWVL